MSNLFNNNVSEIRTKQIEGIDFYKSIGITNIVFGNSDGYIGINDIRAKEVSIKTNVISGILDNLEDSNEDFEYKKYFKGVSKTLSFDHKVKIAFDDLLINMKNEYKTVSVIDIKDIKSLFRVDCKENYVRLLINSKDLMCILGINMDKIKDNNIDKSINSNLREFIIK